MKKRKKERRQVDFFSLRQIGKFSFFKNKLEQTAREEGKIVFST